MNNKACRKCRRIIEGTKSKEKSKAVKVCPLCGSTSFTNFWKGSVLIVDPEKSEVAKIMGITAPGKYALKLSR